MPTFARTPSVGRFRRTDAVFPGFTTGLPPIFGWLSATLIWSPFGPAGLSCGVESDRRGTEPGGPGASGAAPGGGGGGAAMTGIGGMDIDDRAGIGGTGKAPGTVWAIPAGGGGGANTSGAGGSGTTGIGAGNGSGGAGRGAGTGAAAN